MKVPPLVMDLSQIHGPSCRVRRGDDAVDVPRVDRMRSGNPAAASPRRHGSWQAISL